MTVFADLRGCFERARDAIVGRFTHIVLDEMHEMDMDMAFVLVVLKRILATAPSLKLILMSATADSRKTSAYFSAPVPAAAVQQRV